MAQINILFTCNSPRAVAGVDVFRTIHGFTRIVLLVNGTEDDKDDNGDDNIFQHDVVCKLIGYISSNEKIIY